MTFDTDFFRRRIVASLPSRNALPSGMEMPFTEGNHLTQAVIDIGYLLDLTSTDEFIYQAYRVIMGRDCDSSAFVHFRGIIRHGASRQDVLEQLCRSEEARARNIHFSYAHRRRGFVAKRWKGFLNRIRTFASRLFRKSAASVARLFFWQLEVIEDKLDFLVRTEELRTGLLASKVDNSLLLLSEKPDTYAQDLKSRINTLEQTVSILNQQSAAMAALRERQSQVLEELRNVDTYTQRVLAETSREVCRHSDLLNGLAEAAHGLASSNEQIAKSLSELRVTIEHKSDLTAAGLLISRDCLEKVSRRLNEVKGDLDSMVTCTEVDGFIVGVPSAEWRVIGYQRYRGNMEPGLTRYFRSLVSEGMTVVDAGANMGLYTLHAARLVGATGRVHSIEPSPRTWEVLRGNIQVNGLLECGIVQLHQVAVSNCIGEASLAIYSDKSGHNTLYPAELSDRMVRVPVVTLDVLLQNEPHVDLVKIDVEGAEALVFEGMTEVIARNPSVCILMEFSPGQLARAGTEPGSFLQRLTDAGWQIDLIDDESGTPCRVPLERLVGLWTCNLRLNRVPR
jgi:FkbM family methyltransferase